MSIHKNTPWDCWLWGIVLLSGIVLSGCAHSGPPQPQADEQVRRGLTVVLPFVDMVRIFGSNTSVRNPVTSKVFVTGTVEDKASLDLTNVLYRLIGQEDGLKWGNLKASQFAEGDAAIGSLSSKANHRETLQALGQQEGADSVMVGFLYAYRNRTGGDYGVETPSQVAFELVLVQSETGRIIWQRSYQETQKTLSEDLLQLKRFIKRKGRWVSAGEMADTALQEMLKTIPRSHTE